MDKLTKEMHNKAKAILAHAYAPYSQFSVAVCIQSLSNNLYAGVNVENICYNLGLCAESSAIAQMVAAGEQQIKSLVILAGNNLLCTPCGACRQRIYEFSTPETIIHLCNQDTILQSMNIQALLPMAFDF